ncbi:MAG: glycosyltransferase family A protein [Candidatus Neomarinimicrobiota bacterium]
MIRSLSIILFCTGETKSDHRPFHSTLKFLVANGINPESITVFFAGSRPELDINAPILFTPKLIQMTKSNLVSDFINAANSNDYILVIFCQDNPVNLTQSGLELFIMAAKQNPNAGMIYSDYNIFDGTETISVHLLKHHVGRLRDNQDFGNIYFFKRKTIENCYRLSGVSLKNLPFHLRLCASEDHDIIHIAGKQNGMPYTVFAKQQNDSVFDYLLSSKNDQLEAEEILSSHLKQIGAFLIPNQGYHNRPKQKKDATLKASIIIPVNHRPDFIGMAIESILRQTVTDIEAIIVVNGGSEDPTSNVVRKYQTGGDMYQREKPDVRLIEIDINNIGYSLNLGIEKSRGTYYIQLDSDDRLKVNAVEKILEIFRSDSKIGMVIGSYDLWDLSADGSLKKRKDLPVVTHDEWTEENGRNNLLRINGAGAPRAIPTQIIKEMGYFGINTSPFSNNYGEDYDMVLRISELYRIGRIYEPIYEVVRHPGGTDHSIDQATIDRNNEAKDWMRKMAVKRRQLMKLSE